MAERAIQLRRSEMQNANHYAIHGFRVRVDVIEVSGGMTEHVFVYRRKPADAYTGEVVSEFMTVASPVDMSEYPVGAPDPEKGLPFFRLSYVELDFRSTRDASIAWDTIKAEVCNLIASLNRMDVLVAIEDVWCGTAPVVPSSTSSTSSQSI